MTPHDAWDYDGINESVLIDLPADSPERFNVATVPYAPPTSIVETRFPAESKTESLGANKLRFRASSETVIVPSKLVGAIKR